MNIVHHRPGYYIENIHLISLFHQPGYFIMILPLLRRKQAWLYGARREGEEDIMTKVMGKRIARWIPAVIMMILIFVASATPGGEVPEFGAIDLLIKKGGHMTGYALLAIACFWAAYGDTKNVTRSVIIALCISIIYAASDEYHQSFTPDRFPSVIDVGIDAAGAIIGAGFSALITKRRRAK